jgi:glycosyltransferase involved in cell wall biosynthesis
MRILAISPNDYIVGGSDRYFVEQCRLLESYGHDVVKFCVASLRNRASSHISYFPRGVDTSGTRPTDALRFIYSSEAARKLTALLNGERFDLAHLHIYYGNFTGSILAPLRRAGVPIVQTVHDYKPICPVYSLNCGGEVCEACEGHAFWRATVRRCNRGSLVRSALSTVEAYVTDALGARTSIDRFIAVCEFQADKLVHYGVPADRTRVLRNFIDASQFAPATGAEERTRITYFGRIEESKGVFDLLEAFARLPHGLKRGIRLTFAGTGNAAGRLSSRISELAARDVEYLGFVGGDALRSLVRQSICTVIVPHVYENCPMSVLESMALGTPVIGGSIGGIPELIDDGRDGLVVPSMNAASLEAAIDRMLTDPGFVSEAGKVGVAKMHDRFSADVHYEGLMRIYRELLASGARA